MVVPTDFPNIKSIRNAVNGLPDQALVMVFAHYALGILQQQALAWQPPLPAPSMSPTGDNKNESTIRFGSVPYPLPDALGDGELGTTGKKETTPGTPGSIVQTVETRTEASDVKKLKDKDNNKLKDKDNNKMWKGRRLADNAVHDEIKELSAALGREPCPRDTNHFKLVDILAGLKKEMARTPQAAGSQTKSLPIRAPSRRHQGLKPENEGLPNSRPKIGKRSSGAIAAKNPAEDTSSPREQADNHSVGPNNMTTLNSDGPTSKSLPVIEIASADNGAKIEQIPDPRNAAVEEAAAEKKVAQEANEPKRHVLPNGLVIIPVTAQQCMTGAEYEAAEKALRDETADKPANIDKLATVNETIEKTTGNGPTHNGNTTAGDNNIHGHNNEPVLHHAPGAPSTSSFENPRPEQQAKDRIREQAGTTLVGDINQHGISRGLEEIELSLEDLDRGRRFYDEKMWEVSVDAFEVARIFSAETYACLFRQLAYYFTSDHLVSDAHASELYCRDNGFTIRDLMSWHRMQGITLQELTGFIDAVPGLFFRSDVEADYMNVNWDDVYDSYSGLSDNLNEMSDDDKKEYLLKNADQDQLNDIYWEHPITVWNEEKLLDFIVFSRKLVNREGCDSDGAFGVGFASL